MARIVMAMSGGVDSSVAAYLLKEMGHEVLGLFMKNWQEIGDTKCPAEADFRDVVSVCEKLAIPYYSVNFTQEYREKVFSDFLREYEMGYTPNPDILCNREIKFNVLLQKARELGSDFLATGHYCQIQEREGHLRLLKAIDSNKDQTYFLYTLKESLLKEILFPIGHLPKSKVREIAKSLGLKTHDKKDSTGICFIGKRDFREFLSQYLHAKKGAIVDLDSSKVVGEHMGIAFYTIGQRKGLAIGGPGKPWFVAGKRRSSNELLVVQGEDHPALEAPKLRANEVSWIGPRPTFPLRCFAKIRYRAPSALCTVFQEKEELLVEFDRPMRAITPRQSIVFYQDDICLGGAMIIESVGGLIQTVT